MFISVIVLECHILYLENGNIIKLSGFGIFILSTIINLLNMFKTLCINRFEYHPDIGNYYVNFNYLVVLMLNKLIKYLVMFNL